MNFVLCGMMGSGKTELGKLLALNTGREWLDSDEVIATRYGEITGIFAAYGEEYFREKEAQVLKELSLKEGIVLSTGGGAVLRKENVENLKKTGKILFLRAKKDTLLERLSGDKARPLLSQGDENLEEKIQRLLKERNPIYERVADVILDVDDYSPMENVKRALELLKGAGTR